MTLTPNAAWTALMIAGLFEIGWVIGLKESDGFTRLWPSIGTIAAMVASFALLAAAIRVVPAATAYAVWTGIGVAGTPLVSALLSGEAPAMGRMFGIAFVCVGLVTLRLSD
jgi:quaternary ammonium compound-resistance protein SugE